MTNSPHVLFFTGEIETLNTRNRCGLFKITSEIGLSLTQRASLPLVLNTLSARRVGKLRNETNRGDNLISFGPTNVQGWYFVEPTLCWLHVDMFARRSLDVHASL